MDLSRRQGPPASQSTPEEVLRELFVDGVDYDRQELDDLGWFEAGPPFTTDTTAEEFYRQEQQFRGSQQERHLSWWDSEETRSRAWWQARQRPHAKAAFWEWDALLMLFGYRVDARSGDHVSLAWLTSTPQAEFDAWRSLRGSHRKLLQKLEDWIDSEAVEVPRDLPAGCTVSELMGCRLRNLDEREERVIKARFGLGGMAVHTLEEAAVLDATATGRPATRERIRQIEDKALKRIGHGIKGELARALLRPTAERLAQHPACIPVREAPLLVRKGLQPLERLLIKATDLELDGWFLQLIGRTHGDQFLVGDLAEAETVSLAEELDELDATTEELLPMPLERFCAIVEEPDGRPIGLIASALVASRRFGLRNGFVLSASCPRRHLDAIELWSRIRSAGGYVSSRYLGTRSTATHALDHVPDFLRRDRNACDKSPHLFMKVGDDAYLALTLREEMLSPRKPAMPADPHPWQPEPATASALMAKTLRAMGVARFTEWSDACRRATRSSLPDGTMRALSTMRTDLFMRVAPGTYATPDTNLAEHREKLVNAHQVQSYIDARRAGEPHDCYPAWTPGLELAWCRWARVHSPLQYNRLLFYCTIETWDCANDELRWWLNEQERLARPPSPSDLPAPAGAPTEICPDRLLEVICMVALDGGVNQQRVNRRLGMRTEIRTTWAYLALLVATGFVQEGDSWQAWHPVQRHEEQHSALGKIRQKLLEERCRTGTISGGSAAFLRLQQLGVLGLQEGRCSWLAGSSRAVFIDRLSGSLGPPPAPFVTAESTGAMDLDQMLQDALLDEYSESMEDERLEADE